MLIEQAKGKLHEQLGVSTDEAFDVLRTYARARHRDVRGVAEDVPAERVHLG